MLALALSLQIEVASTKWCISKGTDRQMDRRTDKLKPISHRFTGDNQTDYTEDFTNWFEIEPAKGHVRKTKFPAFFANYKRLQPIHSHPLVILQTSPTDPFPPTSHFSTSVSAGKG